MKKTIHALLGLPNKAVVLGGWFVAALIFLLDTIGPLESAVAVLYVLPLIVMQERAPGRTIWFSAIAFAGLALLSFLINHHHPDGIAPVLRLVAGLAAISVTAAALHDSFLQRQLLLVSRDEARSNEIRYRALFDGSGVPLWEQDFGDLLRHISELKREGYDDLDCALSNGSSSLPSVVAMMNTTSVNSSSLRFLDVPGLSEASSAIASLYLDEEFPLRELLYAVFEGAPRFEGRCVVTSAEGDLLSVSIIFTFPEWNGAQDPRVVVAVMELTNEFSLHPHFKALKAEHARTTRIATAGAFSASMGHELAQPLGALVLNAQTCLRWLRMNPPGIRNASAAAERIVSSAERLNNIAVRARSFLNSAPIPVEQVRIPDLVEEILSSLAVKLRAASVAVDVYSVDDIPAVLTNRSELGQILTDIFAIYLEPTAGRSLTRAIAIEIAQIRSGFVRLSVRTTVARIQCTSTSELVCSSSADIALAFALTKATIEALGGSISLKSRLHGDEVLLDIPVYHEI
ncbi:hypothetical protein [Ochrobactrum soli]|uniref:hypothetical protein n=1 Tax=Ochrobactrum soli TaxID=2448455 RepID=UPI000D694D49|nr:hypothetical protein [[Ochrobactrum] soli]